MMTALVMEQKFQWNQPVQPLEYSRLRQEEWLRFARRILAAPGTDAGDTSRK